MLTTGRRGDEERAQEKPDRVKRLLPLQNTNQAAQAVRGESRFMPCLTR
jgi:hypothetical protein